MSGAVQVLVGDCRATLAGLPTASVQACITSPPYYGLRDYGIAGQLGQEPTLDCGGWVTGVECGACYVCHLVDVFRAVRRTLRQDGTLWLNLGDSYSNAGQAGGDRRAQQGNGGKAAYTRIPPGLGEKQLLGVPWRVAFALQADGWVLRSDVIWAKPNAMPESVTDRPTKAHEYLFLFGVSSKYYYDAGAIREPNSDTSQMGGVYSQDAKYTAMGNGHAGLTVAGKVNTWAGRNKRSVWEVCTSAYPGAHFATFPPALVEPCLRASTRPGDTVVDPFAGTGTTAAVALQWDRRAILCELNPAYALLAEQRLARTQPALLTEDVA